MAAVDGARKIAATGEQLCPMLFFTTRESRLQIAACPAVQQLRHSVPQVTELARDLKAVAGVVVSEAVASDDEGLQDVVLVYGEFPNADAARLVTFKLEDRRLVPASVVVPPEMTAWLGEALRAARSGSS